VHKINTNGTSLYSYFAYTALEIPIIMPRHNIDVYHALATMEAIWLPRNKSIATFLDLFTTTNPDRAGAGMGYEKWKLYIGRKYFDFGAKLASRCRYLVSISNKTKIDMIKYLGIKEDKIKVIKLGIPPDLEPLDCHNKRLRIGTLGQFDKRKRIDLLIKQFKASKLDAELVIAGQGMDKPLLESLADGDSRIKFIGLVPNESLNLFYNSLDLFVFPTWIEGYGLPICEAMACKKPVVVMADAILPDELKARCLQTENLTDLFNNYSQVETGIKALDINSNYRFAKTHDWSVCADSYIKLYEEIVSG